MPTATAGQPHQIDAERRFVPSSTVEPSKQAKRSTAHQKPTARPSRRKLDKGDGATEPDRGRLLSQELRDLIGVSPNAGYSRCVCTVGLDALERIVAMLRGPAMCPLADVERGHVLRVLVACGGDRGKAAQVLRIGRRTLDMRLHSWGIGGRGVSLEVVARCLQDNNASNGVRQSIEGESAER